MTFKSGHLSIRMKFNMPCTNRFSLLLSFEIVREAANDLNISIFAHSDNSIDSEPIVLIATELGSSYGRRK